MFENPQNFPRSERASHETSGNQQPGEQPDLDRAVSATDDCLRLMSFTTEQGSSPHRDLSKMKVVFIVNPRSSNPDAEQIAKDAVGHLESLGATVIKLDSKKQYTAQIGIDYQREFRSADALVVAGGDGTLLGLLPLLENSPVPIYMLPTGNESLFAVRYGMTTDANNLERFLKEGQIKLQYPAKVNGGRFFSMISIGHDSLTVAEVVKWREKSGSGKASDSMYTRAGALRLASHAFALDPVLTILADGRLIADRQRGYLIVGNTSSYARNLNLLPDATADNSALYVGFHKSSRPGAMMRELHRGISLGLHREAAWLSKALRPVRADCVEITLHSEEFPVQVDGELYQNRPLYEGENMIITAAKAIPVLVLPSDKSGSQQTI